MLLDTSGLLCFDADEDRHRDAIEQYETARLSTRTRKYDHVCGSALGVVQGAPATDSPGGLSSSAQRGNTPNAAPSLWDRAFLALGSVGRGAQGLLAWHDSTASPSIQNRLGIRDRIYEFEYLG